MDTEGVNFKKEQPETGSQCSNNSPYLMVQRHVDNAKERDRNKNVNIAFSTLRTLIPTEPRDRKLSKIETLRLATSYIVHLANVIQARTKGDFGGQVCERYRCLFTTEMDSTTKQKHICTFCLTDSRRNFQFLGVRNKEGTDIYTSTVQQSVQLSKQTLEKRRQVLNSHEFSFHINDIERNLKQE